MLLVLEKRTGDFLHFVKTKFQEQNCPLGLRTSRTELGRYLPFHPAIISGNNTTTETPMKRGANTCSMDKGES